MSGRCKAMWGADSIRRTRCVPFPLPGAAGATFSSKSAAKGPNRSGALAGSRQAAAQNCCRSTVRSRGNIPVGGRGSSGPCTGGEAALLDRLREQSMSGSLRTGTLCAVQPPRRLPSAGAAADKAPPAARLPPRLASSRAPTGAAVAGPPAVAPSRAALPSRRRDSRQPPTASWNWGTARLGMEMLVLRGGWGGASPRLASRASARHPGSRCRRAAPAPRRGAAQRAPWRHANPACRRDQPPSRAAHLSLRVACVMRRRRSSEVPTSERNTRSPLPQSTTGAPLPAAAPRRAAGAPLGSAPEADSAEALGRAPAVAG